MTVLNLDEHQKCFNSEDEQYRTIEPRKIFKGEIWKSKTLEHRLIFIRKGKLNFELKNQEIYSLEKENFVFISTNEVLRVCAILDSEVIVFRIQKKIQLCPSYPLESLRIETSNKKSSNYGVHSLQFNDILKAYLDQLNLCLSEGVSCKHYCSLKLDELFLLLRIFYSKEQLILLFSSLLTTDVTFSDYILQNHSKHHTLNELAQSMNYSTSGFEKKFKKVFGVSGYKWMKEQKVHRVFEAISSEPKNFKEIAFDLGFSSESYFYDFCKTQIGLTPGQIRKQSKLVE